jgi:hypothetical protein
MMSSVMNWLCSQDKFFKLLASVAFQDDVNGECLEEE